VTTWPELAPAALLQLTPPSQPSGINWAQRQGAWTDEQRADVMRMRWVEQLSDTKIAERVGVSRQRIAELIGKRSDKGSAKGVDGWMPPAALIKECGLPLSPLQSIALDVPDSGER
jgi:hypothetical protein